VKDPKIPNDLRFGSFQIDSDTWHIFGKNGVRIKGVGVIPVRILKHIIDSKPAIVRGTDEAVLKILSSYSKSDREQQQSAYMKYMSTLRRAMGGSEFDALFPNIPKSHNSENKMGGYKFVGNILLSNEPKPQERMDEEGTSSQPMNEETGGAFKSAKSGSEVASSITQVRGNVAQVAEKLDLPGNIEWPEFISRVSNPDPTALRFAETFNADDGRTIGCVVDVFRHPFLESSRSLNETGWSADQVTLVHSGYLNTEALNSDSRITSAFNESEKMRIAEGKRSALQPSSNNPRFTITDTSTPFHDVTNLTINLKQTDYFAILRTRPAIDKYPELRIEFGHIDPSESRIPQTATIQYCAIFGNREILAIQRDKNTFPWAGTWSFSGEEQFDKSDLDWNERDRMKYAMLRTAQEEIFPLARISEKEQLREAMNMVEPYIGSMRIWSIFLEEPTATFSIFCVYDFEFGVNDYANLVREMGRRGLGQPSREGKYHAVRLDDIPRLLIGEAVPARAIFGIGCAHMNPDGLHPTSRYRLVHLLNVLHNQH
jgi:hypothetical protein